ncbi:MAG TPA: ArsR family transcriptional regulator [Woeseiaceae bacterium]|nr:ArsR family transcriptional regulator [Woeseiaceae bacterium]
MQLSPAVEKYVLHWGEMGTRWGTNRTVAQIHALLYLSPEPLRADQICEALSVARSNVSTSIRELQSYGLARMTHVLGDRRDYFESIYDVWELFRVIIEQRKQRELNPTLSMLRECAREVDAEKTTDPLTKQRIANMLEFVENTSSWYEQIREIPTSTLTKLMKLGTSITKLVIPAKMPRVAPD